MIYSTLSNQSIFDVCLMTNGTLDLLSKIVSGNLTSINEPIRLNNKINWDESLTIGVVNKTVEKQNVVMATSQPILSGAHIGFNYILDFTL